MAQEVTDMDMAADEPEIVKVYRCHFCSKYIAAAGQVILTHVQLHVEYMGRDADGRYRCPIETCPLQDPTPEGLAEHLLERHAVRRKAKTTSTAYDKAVRFGTRTKEKLIKMTDERQQDNRNILQQRGGILDNRRRRFPPRDVN